MWNPFKKRKAIVPVPVPRPRKAMKKLIVGFIIGGAISSIIGAKVMHSRKQDDEAPDEDDGDEKAD